MSDATETNLAQHQHLAALLQSIRTAQTKRNAAGPPVTMPLAWPRSVPPGVNR